jgi:hypothetical protein
MAKVKFETLGEVLDDRGITRTAFGNAMGWVLSTVPMKCNRKRNWTVAEYERALVVAKKFKLNISREDMQRYATRSGE